VRTSSGIRLYALSDIDEQTKEQKIRTGAEHLRIQIGLNNTYSLDWHVPFTSPLGDSVFEFGAQRGTLSGLGRRSMAPADATALTLYSQLVAGGSSWWQPEIFLC
jgi:hypothetical protein